MDDKIIRKWKCQILTRGNKKNKPQELTVYVYSDDRDLVEETFLKNKEHIQLYWITEETK